MSLLHGNAKMIDGLAGGSGKRQVIVSGKVDENGLPAFLLGGLGDNVVPALTADNSGNGYIASASSTQTPLSSYSPYMAFDRLQADSSQSVSSNPTHFWASTATACWLAIELPLATAIGGYTIQARDNASGSINQSPKDWTLEGSNDGGTTWTVVDTRSGETGWSAFERRTYTLAATATYSKYRINITANNGNASNTSIDELELLASDVASLGSVSISAPDPLVLSFANGFDANGKPKDEIVVINEDVAAAWSNLTADTTNYLYASLDPVTKALTYGQTIVAPVYQAYETPPNLGHLGTAISGGDVQPANQAFDGSYINDTSHRWQSSQVDAARNNAAYIGKDFGAGNTVQITSLKIAQLTGENAASQVKLQSSDDGIAWVDIDTGVALLTNTTNPQTINLSAYTVARYFRIMQTAGPNANPSNGDTWCVLEIELFGTTTMSTGNFWFDINKYAMCEYSNGSWQNALCLFLGEADTDATGNVIAVRPYATNGRYDSGWFAVAANTNYSKNHNLGIPLPGNADVSFFFSPGGDDSDANIAHDIFYYGSSAIPYGHNQAENIASDTRDALRFGFRTNVQSYRNANYTSGYYRVLANRNW